METILHLFFYCPFSQQVWSLLYNTLNPRYSSPDNWHSLFMRWKQNYSESFVQKPLFVRIWKAIPKYICWELWLVRNKSIFQNIDTSPSRILALASGLISEFLLSEGLSSTSFGQMDHNEAACVNIIINTTALTPPSPIRPKTSHWKLRLTNPEFHKWRQGKNILFFDGASAGNPGAAGARGVLFDFKGKEVLTFAWGLGISSNNLAEAWTAYMGINLINLSLFEDLFIVRRL